MNRYEVILQSGKRLIVNANNLEELEHILNYRDNKEPWVSIKPYQSMARAVVDCFEPKLDRLSE